MSKDNVWKRLQSRWLAAAALVCMIFGIALAVPMAMRSRHEHLEEKKWLPERAVARLKHPHPVMQVVFTPDGKRILCGTYARKDSPGNPDGPSVWAWDQKRFELIFSFAAQQGHVLNLALSPDGKTLASAGWPADGVVHFWDLETRVEKPAFTKVAGLHSIAYSASGRYFAWINGNIVNVWDLSAKKQAKQWTLSSPCTLSISPDEKALACFGGTNGCSLILLDLASGSQVESKLKGGNGCSLSFSPDSRMVATSGNSVVQLFAVPTGTELGVLGGRNPHLAFAPNGRMLATSGDLNEQNDWSVRLIETATGKERDRFGGHDNYILHVAFSPDGKVLASTSEDRTVILWDVAGSGRKPGKLTEEESQTAWAKLASADAAVAYDAIRTWSAAGPAAAVQLVEHVRRALAGKAPCTPKQVANWARALTDPEPGKRKKAVDAIEQQGVAVLPVLRELLDGGPPPEVGRQIDVLLQLLPKHSSFAGRKPYTPENLQLLRALEAAENMGVFGRSAAGLLAEGAPDLQLAVEAASVLRRLPAQAP